MQLAQLFHRGSTPGADCVQITYFPGSACQQIAACRHIRRYASKCFTIRHCSRHNSQFWRSTIIIYAVQSPTRLSPSLVAFPDSSGLTGLLQGNSCSYINVRYRALTCPNSPRITQPRRNANRVTIGVFAVPEKRVPCHAEPQWLPLLAGATHFSYGENSEPVMRTYIQIRQSGNFDYEAVNGKKINHSSS
jgi:hypothetical protein